MLAFQFRNIVWKMSLPAQPDWIFHVIVSARDTTSVAAPEAVGADDVVVGAFCDRHDVTKAARPESDPYLRNPRRENFERRLTALSTS
jgi:hypothetical protein